MADFSPAEIAAALDECAREPVHIPGAIQPFGCLLSFDQEMSRVLQVSANLQDVLGCSPADALASSPARLLGAKLLKAIREKLAGKARISDALLSKRRLKGLVRHFYVTAYRSGSRVVVELELLKKDLFQQLLPTVNGWLMQINEASDPQSLMDILVASVQQLTGYQRVMVYQFDQDEHGSVVTESTTGGAYSFLGHHFPASDIPAQVRRLYDVNPVRSIPDATAAAVPLVPDSDPLEGTPLDLSQGALRAASPIHLLYLTNMGVGAALSIAMHTDEGLWGLVSCHALEPRPLSPVLRDHALSLVQLASSRLMLLQARADSDYLRRVRNSRELILSSAHGELLSPQEMLQRQGPEWIDLFRASGIALVYHDLISRVGDLPGTSEIKQLAEWLSQSQRQSSVWQTRALQEVFLGESGDKSICCGLLAIRLPVSGTTPGWLLLFRPELVETRVWAGKPEHLPMVRDGNLILSPRRSFEAWREVVRGFSEPWSGTQLQAARDLGEDLAMLIFSREVGQLNAELIDANRQLEELARTDALTGLPNRRVFEDRAERRIERARQEGKEFALLFVDLDRFKQINDSLGHQAGDQLIRQVGIRLKHAVRDTDTVARLSGDEFAILLEETRSREDALTVRDKVQHAFREPFELAGQDVQVSISVGISCFPADGSDLRTLMHRADMEMYQSKRRSRRD